MRIGPFKFAEVIHVNGKKDPLLVRYIVFRCPAWGIYIHHMLRDDNDRALHDHPWPFISVVLRGGYWEHHDQGTHGLMVRRYSASGAEYVCPSVVAELRRPGNVLVRPAEWRHRFELAGKDAWTLVIVGRRSRPWGFWLPDGWCWWRKHNAAAGICEDEVIWDGGGD